jgi:type IV pilus assembly protein PilF
MQVHILFLSTMIFLFSCSSTQENKKTSKQADIHYSYGTEELFNKNYTKAISHLLKAIKLDPNNPEVHNNLAMAYYFKEEKEMALKHIKRALELDPKNTDSLVNLASLQFEFGDFIQAEKNYKKALKDLTFEKHARTYYNLSLIEIKRRNFIEAKKYLNKSVQQSEDYCPSWLQLGKIELQAGNSKAAAKHFHQARMGTCTNTPAPLYWHAVALAESGDFLNARMKFDELQTKFADSEFYALASQKLTELTLMEARGMNRTKHSQNLLDETNF